MVRCNDNSLYTGIATDVKRRVEEHNHDGLAAAYTRSRRPVSLVYMEKCADRSDAAKREFEIKQLTKNEKEKMLCGKG